MKIRADCVPCLMKRVLFQARLDDRSDEFASVEAGVKALAKSISASKTTSEVGTEVHAAAYSKLSMEDPYRKLKVNADAIADKLSFRAQKYVDESDDKLRAALLVSVVGNIMDFGSNAQAVDAPEEFEKMFDDLIAEGLGVYDEEIVQSLVNGATNIAYFFDNCGESQLDRILIRELRKNGKHVTGVVRGKPILNDVTKADAVRTGLDTDLDALLDTGKFYVGVDWQHIPVELNDALNSTNLIIMKGMANYECTSEMAMSVPIIHVLRAKCKPVSESAGIPIGNNAVFAVLNGRRMSA